MTAEMKAKVVFVGKLLKFVEWPVSEGKKGGERGGARGGEKGGGLEGGGSPLQFCVEGDRYLSFALARELYGTKAQGRSIDVHSLLAEPDLRSCDAVYFAGALKGASGSRLAKLQGAKVLTLGEEKGFLDAGGMVEISCKGDTVQFEVNLDAVRSGGLKIDARLLEMAKSVTRARRTVSD